MQPEDTFERPERNGGKAKRILRGLIVGLVLIGILAGVLWLISLERAATAPLRTSDAFIKALLDNQPDKAYDLTSEDFRAETSREALAATAENASKGLDKKTLKVSQGEMEDVERGKLATVFYDVKGQDTTYRLKVTLLKEQDKGWLVVNAVNEVKE